ncbi:unnamed protein product [Ascophyllum nodosum]
MESLFDVVICEPIALDTESDRSMFVSWVRGLSAQEVTSQRLHDFQTEVAASSARMGKVPAISGVQLSFRRRGSTAEETTQDEALNQKRQLEALFDKETVDAYRVFNSMEHFLCQPEYLRGQLQVQIDDPTQGWMVTRYHELDDAVVREILGKKVTSKTRKDLDDVSDLTGVPLRSCHRQYDNIRRLLSNLEDSSALPHMSVAKEVREKVGLPLGLAAKYTAVVFLLHLRFQIYSSRRSTAHLTADDLCCSAMGLLNYWVGEGDHLRAFEEAEEKRLESEEGQTAEETEVVAGDRFGARQRAMQEGLLEIHGLEFDKRWIRLLRVIKSQLLTDLRSSMFEDLRQHTVYDLRAAELPESAVDAISTRLHSTIKALVSIGSGLSMTKEYRGVFEDLIEKVGNPLREQGLGLKDMVSLLGALVRGFTKVCPRDNLLRSDEPGMVDAWRRYIYGVRVFFRYAYRETA